jgi:glycerol-3-phosphate O-acyltransferase
MGLKHTPRIINLSQMVERFNLFVRLFAFIFFRHVRLDHASTSSNRRRIVEAAEGGAQVVYVFPSRSMLDYVFFNYRFLRDDLPLSRFIPGVSMLLMNTLAAWVRYLFNRLRGAWLKPNDLVAQFSRIIEHGRPVTLYVREPEMLLQWGERGRHLTPYLEVLVEHHRKTGREVVFVPLLLVKQKGIQRYRKTLLDRMLGDPQAPGGLRQLVSFVWNVRKVRVNVPEPVRLGAALAQTDIAPLTPSDQADALRLLLRNHVALEEHAIHGPPLKGAPVIIREMLRNDDLHRAVEAKGYKWDARTEKRMRAYLTEIAADFKFRSIEFLSLVISFLTERLYRGVEIDEPGLERMREEARKGPLILLPCHRSHFDYLAISNILYSYGLIPPHIVAGANLSFWPIGGIFRHSGALFIRRSFKGNVLYSESLKWYLWKILREGYWLEFFLEGGRSRTGKLLPPRYGVLKTVVQAHTEGFVPQMVLVPLYVGYEKILEDESLARELTGVRKEKENVAALLKSAKVLRSKYGRLYFQVGETIDLAAEVTAAGGREALQADPELLQWFLRRIAHKVEDYINRAAVVTAGALVAMSLFTSEGRGLAWSQLVRRVGFFLDLLWRKQARLSHTLQTLIDARRVELSSRAAELGLEFMAPGLHGRASSLEYLDAVGGTVREAALEALNLFQANKAIRMADLDGERVVEMFEDRRIRLDIYRNQAMHALLNESLVALVVGSLAPGAHMSREELHAEVLFLSRMFKKEFVYPTAHGFAHNVDASADFLRGMGLLQVAEDGAMSLPEAARTPMTWLASNVRAFVEGYAFVIQQAPAVLHQEVAPDAAVKELMHKGRRASIEGSIKRSEAISTSTFRNALDWLKDEGLAEGDDRLALNQRGAAEVPALVARLARFR